MSNWMTCRIEAVVPRVVLPGFWGRRTDLASSHSATCDDLARMFVRLTKDKPDREGIRREYAQKALSIYDRIPMSVDRRAGAAAERFSRVFA